LLGVRTRVLWGVVVALALVVTVGARFDHGAGGNFASTPVLVAQQTIPEGTPGTIVVKNGMYVPTTLPQKEVEENAIADPQFLTGRAASAEILPGEQLTALKFAASTTTTVNSQITGLQRVRP
jgi:hypothetical protein